MIPKILDQFKTVLPSLSKIQYNDLEESIKMKGQMTKIVTCQIGESDDLFILDGHNRYEIVTKLGSQPLFEDIPIRFKTKEEAMIWIIDFQALRRNIPTYVRAALVLKKKDLLKKIGKEVMGQSVAKREDPDWLKKPLVANNKPVDAFSTLKNHDTHKQLAKEAGVSGGTLHKIEKIEKEGCDELKEKARSGEITVNAAYKELRGLNSDELPTTDIDKTIEKTRELANKIFSFNEKLNDDQRENIFDITEVLDKCVHAPEEYNPNLPSFGDYEV